MKVAVCLSGHTRTSDKTFQSLMNYVVRPNNADVFLHTWSVSVNGVFWKQTEDHSIENVHRDVLCERYHPKSILIEDQIDFANPEIEACNQKCDNKLQNIKSMWYSAKRAYQLAIEHDQYDFIVRCRPDFTFYKEWCVLMTMGHQGGPLYASDRLYIPWQNSWSNVGVCDGFACGSPEQMKIYHEVYDHFDSIFLNLPLRTNGRDWTGVVPEEALARYLASRGVVVARNYLPYFSICRANHDDHFLG